MRITKYLIGGLAALALVGCKDKMRELNTNPETIGETDPRYMFMNMMADFEYSTRGAITNAYSSEGRIMQYFVQYQGASDNTYCNPRSMSYVTPGTLGIQYSWLYSVGYKAASIMNYMNDVMTETEASRYTDLYAMCGIVKIFEAFRVFQNYGAAVYSDGFKAITEGITTPKYDIFTKEVYEALDTELAEYIKVLADEADDELAIGVGKFDPLYGWKVSATGAPTERNDYDEQRTLWKKFANSYRLHMAWVMRAVDEARFNDVFAETKASGWYESDADGCFAYQSGFNQNKDIYNSNGASDVSLYYALSDNFVSYLKGLNDPRLPLLARANNLFADNTSLQWIQNYFPDSLIEHAIYNKETKTWEVKSWDGLFDIEGDPMLAYQGLTPNPEYSNDADGPGTFWIQRSFTFRFYHPDYRPNDPTFNEKLEPWTVTNKGTVTEKFPAEFEIENPVYSISLEVASRPQGRYFVACGGKSFGSSDGGNGYDGSVENRPNIFYRRPVYTYPEFCFMMAYLTNDGLSTGKSADEWYSAGVTAAMKELQADAVRYEFQVASDVAQVYNGYYVNPTIVGVNDAEPYDLTDKIDAYVSANALSNATDKVEAIVGQMWIYCYNQPEKMWDWWRLTGYPKIVEVATPADRPTGLYWVKPVAAGGDELAFPRRGALPQADPINNANYNAARDALLGGEYGSQYNQTTGRIFWDVQGL